MPSGEILIIRCANYCADLLCFFFNDTATTEIYTLSLHDALPISQRVQLQVLSEQVAGKRIGRIHVTQPPGRGYPESMLRHTELGAAVALARAGGEARTLSGLPARAVLRSGLGRGARTKLSGPLASPGI